MRCALLALLDDDWRGDGPIVLTMHQLGERMGTSRKTAMRAVRDLEGEGLLAVRRGYVTARGRHVPSSFLILFAVLLPLLEHAEAEQPRRRLEHNGRERHRSRAALAKVSARLGGVGRSLPVNRPGRDPARVYGARNAHAIGDLIGATMQRVATAAPPLSRQGDTRADLDIENYPSLSKLEAQAQIRAVLEARRTARQGTN
jgi:DNA-binding Lrp family transcriptional regulator